MSTPTLAFRDVTVTQLLAEPQCGEQPKARRRLNAWASLQDILLALSRVAWGPLQGRTYGATRATLEILSLMMREQKCDYDASIVTTAKQLSERAGYSLKQTRRVLQFLEDSDVVEWRRGGIADGRPQAGVLRVNKKKLVEWTLAWRDRHDKEAEEFRKETLNRIERIRVERLRGRLPSQKPRSVHVDTTSSLSFNKRERSRGLSREKNPSPVKTLEKSREMIARAKERRKNVNPPVDCMPMVCGHGNGLPERCNPCRSEAWQVHQRRVRMAEEEAARLRAEARTVKQAARAAAQAELEAYTQAHYPGISRTERAFLCRTDHEYARLLELAVGGDDE